MESKFIDAIAFTLPALVTGFTAYYLFASYFKEQKESKAFLLQKENQRQSLPIRLQAYERMTLFLERINLTSCITRIVPFSEDKKEYANFVIEQIEQEFEHNLAQQIYLSSDTWNFIITAKQATIQIIRNTCNYENLKTAHSFREFIIQENIKKQSPSIVALDVLKKEVALLW